MLQVEMLVNQPLKCPISLESPPLCPQITPCGHVFAFPSIMAHLMSHGGDSLRKASPCPLCNAPIVARELRLVRAHVTPATKVNSRPTSLTSVTQHFLRNSVDCSIAILFVEDLQAHPIKTAWDGGVCSLVQQAQGCRTNVGR